MKEKKLRSSCWFGRSGKDGFAYRAWMEKEGIPSDMFENKPVIGICNTWSELTPCNSHFRVLAEAVKKGVLEAGGFPLEFPVMSLGETLIRPTAMLYRNLVSMDVEESIRANPLDGVVLLCGCDKTTPALVMGACSVDIPTIVVSGGPMLKGHWKGKDISTSDLWRLDAAFKIGQITSEEFKEAESCTVCTEGHCAVMGTASTMAAMVESLGLSLPHNASIPAVDARRKVLSRLSGRRIVEMVKEGMTLSRLLTREAFENAIMVNAAIGGSTNFVIHLLAIAGRIGVKLKIDDFDKYSQGIPLLTNIQPSGKYFMEDLYYSGGLPAVIRELSSIIHHKAITANGKSIGENCASAEVYNRDVIGTLQNAFKPESGIVVVKGNLAPNGAVIKPSAATPVLLKHIGKAVVFENIEDYHARIDNPDLDINSDSIMILKNVGPRGYPGMAEVGNMTLPKKLLEQGVTDLVRISDGRMSGTGFGTVVLHVSPEAAVGGTLALVRDGDIISLDTHKRTLQLEVSEEELLSRKAVLVQNKNIQTRGYVHLYRTHVDQAHLGADMDFLKGCSGSAVARDSH
jgi:dihydroxy-acid dehydratase